MLRQWNLSWNEKFDLNLESDELFCVWVDHKPINPLNTPTPTLLLVSSTEDLKTVPNLRFDSKPVQINLLFQSYIHLVAFPSEWASSIIGWNNHRSTTGLLFCSDNMGFVLLLNEQHGFCFVPMSTTWLSKLTTAGKAGRGCVNLPTPESHQSSLTKSSDGMTKQARQWSDLGPVKIESNLQWRHCCGLGWCHCLAPAILSTSIF